MKLILFLLTIAILNTQVTQAMGPFEHENPGCPENSTCPKEMGSFYAKWAKALTGSRSNLNKFASKHGVPFSIWTKPLKDKKDLIEWDSPCPNHRLEDKAKRIHIALVKTKHLKDLNNPGYLIRELITLKPSGPSHKSEMIYQVPRDDLPSYFVGDNLAYEQHFENNYFTLKVTPKGSLSYSKKKAFKKSLEVSCHQDLIKAYRKRSYPKELYQYFQCRNVWDIKSRKWRMIIYGKACS